MGYQCRYSFGNAVDTYSSSCSMFVEMRLLARDLHCSKDRDHFQSPQTRVATKHRPFLTEMVVWIRWFPLHVYLGDCHFSPQPRTQRSCRVSCQRSTLQLCTWRTASFTIRRSQRGRGVAILYHATTAIVTSTSGRVAISRWSDTRTRYR